jgi:probable O-glycosylation ligase (exosortase A-associated)
MRDIVFVMAFLAMLPMALRFAHAGTMLWAWIALISPNTYIYGFARGLPFNKIVVAVAAVSLVLDKNRRKFYWDTHNRLLVGFLAIAFISYMCALSNQARGDALMDRLWKEVLLCLFMVVSIRGRMAIHSMLIAMSMGMAIHGTIEGAKYIKSGGGHIVYGPATIGDNNSFGLAILLVIPMLMYLYRYTVSKFVKIPLALAIVTNFVGVISTNSRGALLGLLAVGFMMFLRSKRKFGLAIFFIIFAIGVVTLAPERYLGRVSTIGSAEEDGSFMGRVNSWKLHFLVAVDRPLVGGGFSPMEDIEVWRAYLPMLSTLDFIPTGRPTNPLAAHSIYFEVLGDTGFIGFFLFTGLIFVGFRNANIVARLSKGNPDLEWAADLSRTLQFSLVAYAVSGAALSMAYFEMFYIVITMLSVTRKAVEEIAIKEIPAGLRALQGDPRTVRGLAPAMSRPVPAGFGQTGFTPPK